MRCKECKKNFEVKYFLQKFCLKKDKCIAAHIEYARKQTLKDWGKKKAIIKDSLLTVQDLLKSTQKVFNTYIRERDKGKPCISCKKEPKKINAGHYYSSGGHKNLTFNECNVWLQCEYCNTYLHGNLIEYRKNLIKKIGKIKVDWLDENAHVTRKFTRDELKEIAEKYKEKTKELKNKYK